MKRIINAARRVLATAICRRTGHDLKRVSFVINGEEYTSSECRRCGASVLVFDPPIIIPPYGSVEIGVTVVPRVTDEGTMTADVEVSK